MYNAILILLLAAGLVLLIFGAVRRSAVRLYSGSLIIVLTILFFWFMDFWGGYLWYESLGYSDVYLKIILSRTILACLGAGFSLLCVLILLRTIPGALQTIRYWPLPIAALIGAVWGYHSWDIVLKYLNRVDTGVKDPLFGKDSGFYLFTLPFYDRLQILFILLALLALLIVLVAAFVSVREGNIELRIESDRYKQTDGRLFRRIYLCLFIFFVAIAAGKFLDRYHLMYSEWGVVKGPGWTDVHVRLPAYNVVIVLTLALGVLPLFGFFRSFIRRV